MEGRSRIATDTLLGILAHSSLALGLVVLSFSTARGSLESYLFGDLLTVGTSDLIMIGLTSVVIGAVLYLAWKPLLSITLQEELARVEGLNVQRYRLILMVLVALLVSISMKVVGVLLITALLIIPPAAARSFTRSPVTMALAASAIGCIAVLAGLGSSWLIDTQVGPSIVLAASVVFVLSLIFRTKQS
jgi:zinc transport system permease protein